MKLLTLLFLLYSASSFSKIVILGEKVFFENNGKQVPIILVNQLIDQKEVSHLKLYNGGEINIISFAKGNQKELLYSVDENGFLYSIEPFTGYQVEKVFSDGNFTFKQLPGKKYHISSKGFFLY
ncbi:MAG: hypothetical protein AB7I27_06950 [Bacteriovoracaceae bacterium]